MNTQSPLLAVDGLTASYQDRTILQGINFMLNPGEFVSIVGPNGTGKTTLLRCIAGILPKMSGNVSIGGRAVSSYSRRELARLVAVSGQLDDDLEYTVQQTVNMGRYPHIGRFNSASKEDYTIVEQALKQVGIWEKRHDKVSFLSQGERQKVSLARALAQNPSLLLLDEPTSHLDIKNQIEVLSKVKQLSAERQMGVLAVIHDINLAVNFSTHIVLLNQGRVVAYGPSRESVTVEKLSKIYGVDFKVFQDDGSLFLQPDYGVNVLNKIGSVCL